MLEKLKGLDDKYRELMASLADPETIQDRDLYMRLSKEQSELKPIVDKIREYTKLLSDIDDARDLMKDGDQEIKDMAVEELSGLEESKPEIEEALKLMLLPKDPRDERNVFLEIRAGTGGEEAGLFAADLFKMYSKYAEIRGWKVEVIDTSPTGVGGLKEITALVQGRGAFSRLKYESGVHRVQRVPATETSGRIHTSAATVAVMPEADDVDVKISKKELKVDTYRASGAGGQHVNKTSSAIRITHLPTGIVVQCQDGRSQLKNREKAMKVLKARLYEVKVEEQEKEISESRKSQVGGGDRSERIRTYNYPQARVTDHRVGLTLQKLPQILEGDLDDFIDALITHFQAEKLKEVA